jgi:hypothetical protein
MPRAHISLTTKLASALLALGDIPYEDAKQLTAAQICSLYVWDHGVLHGIAPINEPWNLTPRLIAPHREKSKRDTGIVAKVRRLEAHQRDHAWVMSRLADPPPREPKRKRKISSRGFGPKKPKKEKLPLPERRT